MHRTSSLKGLRSYELRSFQLCHDTSNCGTDHSGGLDRLKNNLSTVGPPCGGGRQGEEDR